MAQVAPWKVEAVADLVKAMTEHPTIGVVSIEGIPASQLQKMRSHMRSDVTMLVSKSTLFNIALKEAAKKGHKGLDGLSKAITGPCALVTTDRNPFKLYKLMESTKAPAAAKGGEVAPEDILIRGGDTNFKPGPIVRDLQKVGIPAAIDKGKVIIRKDAVLVKKGDIISKEIAQVLPKLDILPIIMGLDLRAVFEDGVVYQPDVLRVDEVKVRAQFGQGAFAAFNLAISLGYPTAYTIRPLLLMARTHALALGVEAGVLTEETVAPIIQKSHFKALALAMRLNPEALDDEIRARLAGAAAAAAPAATDAGAKPEKKTEKREQKEEPKVTEEDAAAGLNALFG